MSAVAVASALSGVIDYICDRIEYPDEEKNRYCEVKINFL